MREMRALKRTNFDVLEGDRGVRRIKGGGNSPKGGKRQGKMRGENPEMAQD